MEKIKRGEVFFFFFSDTARVRATTYLGVQMHFYLSVFFVASFAKSANGSSLVPRGRITNGYYGAA